MTDSVLCRAASATCVSAVMHVQDAGAEVYARTEECLAPYMVRAILRIATLWS